MWEVQQHGKIGLHSKTVEGDCERVCQRERGKDRVGNGSMRREYG